MNQAGGRRPGSQDGQSGPAVQDRRDADAATNPRPAVAFDVLRAVAERDAYANLALPPLLVNAASGGDAAFATELTYGTCRTGFARCGDRRRRDARSIRSTRCFLDLRRGTYQLLLHQRCRTRRGVDHRGTGGNRN